MIDMLMILRRTSGLLKERRTSNRRQREKLLKKGKDKRPRKGESSGGSSREEPAEDLALLGELGINIPLASDFSTIMRVYECSARIAEVAGDSPEILLLRKKLKKAEVAKSNLDANLLDRRDKLDYCNKVLIPGLLEENRCLRGVVISLLGAENQIAEAERQLAASSLEVEEAAMVERDLEATRKLESEAKTRVVAFRQQVQLLESDLDGEEEKIANAKSEDFLHA